MTLKPPRLWVAAAAFVAAPAFAQNVAVVNGTPILVRDIGESTRERRAARPAR